MASAALLCLRMAFDTTLQAEKKYVQTWIAISLPIYSCSLFIISIQVIAFAAHYVIARSL